MQQIEIDSEGTVHVMLCMYTCRWFEADGYALIS